jgi:hypothetical protein
MVLQLISCILTAMLMIALVMIKSLPAILKAHLWKEWNPVARSSSNV